jgi:hypothetical protein
MVVTSLIKGPLSVKLSNHQGLTSVERTACYVITEVLLRSSRLQGLRREGDRRDGYYSTVHTGRHRPKSLRYWSVEA